MALTFRVLPFAGFDRAFAGDTSGSKLRIDPGQEKVSATRTIVALHRFTLKIWLRTICLRTAILTVLDLIVYRQLVSPPVTVLCPVHCWFGVRSSELVANLAVTRKSPYSFGLAVRLRFEFGQRARPA